MTERMNRNGIALNRYWACLVLMLAAVFSVAAQGKGIAGELMPAINLVNISTNKKSLALGGLSNIVKEKAFGVQIGGLYNHIGDMGRGVAIAGLGNTVLGSYYGMQIGGLWNYNADASKGLMIGGLSNIVGDSFDGMQLAGLTNTAKDTKGVQVAGLANWVKDMYGMQLAGLVNISQDTYGLQLAGLTNITKDVYGLQLAGLTNISQDAFGLQIAGLTNIAKEVYGMQFAGLVNVAKRVKGVQFASILNVAEESDCPIGLINIVKNGSMGVAFTYDMMGNALASFRSGGKFTYGIVGVGLNQHMADKLVLEAGYGVHIPVCKWLQVNNEVKATAPVNTSSTNFAYLLAPSITLWNHCNLFAGASINYLMADKDLDFVPKRELWNRQSADGVHHLYIGYQVGVQYVF